jgi:predicted aspartyl protease
MKIQEILAAAVAVALLGTQAQAQTPACSLALMASLDMTFLPDGRFAVPVSLNGTPHEFMVDTSGVYTEISDEAAQKLGLKEVETGMAMYGVGGKMKMRAARVDSFKVGNNEAKGFHIAIAKSSTPAPEKEPGGNSGGDVMTVDGLLAPDFLNLFDVELDFAAKKMNLFSQDHCPGKVTYWTRGAYAQLPFHYTSGNIAMVPHINIEMTLDAQSVTTDLDTGSVNSWLRQRAASRLFGIDEKTPGVVRSPLSSDKFPMLRKQFASLTMDGLTVQNPQVDLVADREEDAFRMEHSEKSRDDPIYGSGFNLEPLTLGMNVIGKLHIYIAYKEHKIYVTAADAH